VPTIFKWDSVRELGPHRLPFRDPVHGRALEIELTSGHRVRVFRADDGQFYFCHGLTFGGKDAPGGALSPFSGPDVLTILDNHYTPLDAEASGVTGDILVWRGPDDETPHSAILIDPIVQTGTDYLAYTSLLRSKNGKLPEATVTLGSLVSGPDSYGESFRVYRPR
jgi:hypothetical protein